MTTSDGPILIAGGGIGGLTAALALIRRGFDVEIIEQAHHLAEVGAGLQISANGTRVLFELGLEKPLMQRALVPEGKEIRLWNTGQRWKLFDLGAHSVEKYGFPYVMMHRADLLDILKDAVLAAKPDAIHPGQKIAGFEADDSGVRLRTEAGAVFKGRALVGADGVHSVIRKQLFGSDAPKFTGCMAWRALVPAAGLRPDLRRRVGSNWVGPGRHVVTYPLRGGEVMNFVGIVERDDWRSESWSTRGSKEECAADFIGWNDEIQELIAGIDVTFKWALMGREPLATWSRGPVTLLGDSCHPTLPFLAQGAVMAIEDGLVLARCAELHRDNLPEAFTVYEGLRKDRTARIVLGSADNAKRFHSNSLSETAEAQAYVDTQWSEEQVIARYDWLFRYNAVSLPLTPDPQAQLARTA